MQAYADNKLSQPEFLSLHNIASLFTIASANFFRNANNDNSTIYIPMGPAVDSVYTSPDVYLPLNILNGKTESNTIKFANNRDAFVVGNVTCVHNILIYFKLNKADGNNFANQREIRVDLVRADGSSYNTIFASYQPDTGAHTAIILNKTLVNQTNDVVRIKFNLFQDNKLNDNSDTLLTIFSVAWNIEVFKNF